MYMYMYTRVPPTVLNFDPYPHNRHNLDQDGEACPLRLAGALPVFSARYIDQMFRLTIS